MGVGDAVTLHRRGIRLRDSANLDFVRSIAVLSVLADHVLETLGAFHGFVPTPFAWFLGRMGVLLFFVLTCLVLLQSLARSAHQGRSSALAFFVRRGFRIYPLALITIVAVLLLRVPDVAWGAGFTQPTVGQLLANLSLSMNLFYSEPVLSVLWSLPYELQMYLCLPLVYLCVRGDEGLRNAVLLWIAGVAAAQVVPELVGRLSVAFFAPCFLAGVLAFALERRVQRTLPFAALPLALAGLMTVYCVVATASGEMHPRWLGYAFCLAVGVLLPFVRELEAPWLRAPAHAIAKCSYGIYLFHMLALWAGFHLLREAPLAAQVLVAAGLLVALPLAGYHGIERPGIHLGARLARGLGRAHGEPRYRRADARAV